MKNGKKKHRIVLWCCVALAVWVIAGGYANRNIFYLMGSEHSSFPRDVNIAPSFGVRFRKHLRPQAILWLDDEKCEVLWRKILNGCEGPEPSGVGDIRIFGNFYSYAQWADRLGMKTIFRPLQPWMEVRYIPAKSLLYISQDCEELGWEYSYGLIVQDVSPELLGIDIEVFVRDLEERNIERKKYEPLLKMISDKKNESGGENND